MDTTKRFDFVDLESKYRSLVESHNSNPNDNNEINKMIKTNIEDIHEIAKDHSQEISSYSENLFPKLRKGKWSYILEIIPFNIEKNRKKNQ